MRLRVKHSGEKALKISHLTILAANILVMIVARKFKYSAFENKHSSRFGRDVLLKRRLLKVILKSAVKST